MGNCISKPPQEKLKERSPKDQPGPLEQHNVSDSQDSSWTVSNERYTVCSLLAAKGVSSAIWFEDLLALHGSNTLLWDLNLLVRDPRAAANALQEAGYNETPPDSKFEDEPEFSKRSIRMARSPDTADVVLLPAQDWYYDLNETVHSYLPALSEFLDSMIEFWLNISSRDYVDRLGFALYIGCLINYCYYLKGANGEVVKDPAFAIQLKPEHREVHYDIVAVAPKKGSFTTTRRHRYHTRRSREIKEGLFTPEPYQKGVFQAPLTTVSEGKE